MALSALSRIAQTYVVFGLDSSFVGYCQAHKPRKGTRRPLAQLNISFYYGFRVSLGFIERRALTVTLDYHWVEI